MPISCSIKDVERVLEICERFQQQLPWAFLDFNFSFCYRKKPPELQIATAGDGGSIDS